MIVKEKYDLGTIKNMEAAQPRPEPKPTPFGLRLIQFAFANVGPLMPRLAAKIAFRLFTRPRRRALHRQSDSILEKAKIFEVLYANRILKGYEWGSGDKIALLVHGWESRGTALRSFVPALLAEGFRVVAFDAPAHGNSEGKRTNLPHFGGAVRAIVNHLGGVHSILCHSFGGVSAVFALSKLDKQLAIERLVLIGVPSKMRYVMQSFFQTICAPRSVQNAFFKLIERILKMPPDEANVERAIPFAAIGQILVVHDKTDDSVPVEEGYAIAEAVDHAHLLLTEGFGHYKLLKSEKVIGQVVNFLND